MTKIFRRFVTWAPEIDQRAGIKGWSPRAQPELQPKQLNIMNPATPAPPSDEVPTIARVRVGSWRVQLCKDRREDPPKFFFVLAHHRRKRTLSETFYSQPGGAVQAELSAHRLFCSWLTPGFLDRKVREREKHEEKQRAAEAKAAARVYQIVNPFMPACHIPEFSDYQRMRRQYLDDIWRSQRNRQLRRQADLKEAA
jgi:hypothetical protein